MGFFAPVAAFFQQLLNTESFPPRWLCGGGWQPFTGWFMITADLLIFGAYTSIPILLLYFIRRKKDMVFPRIFWLFAAFIFACGVSHLLDAAMFWWPAYRLNALERFFTGVISWVTVFALIPAIPMALSLRTPAELEREIEERQKAEAELRAINERLESIVAERTEALNQKARQLELTNHELEAFSYSVSHDLKSPLRRIEFFYDMLLQKHDGYLDEESRDYLDRIAANATSMSALIDRLLSFSRLSKAPLKQEALNLTAMAQALAHEIPEQNSHRQVQFDIQPGLQAIGDPVLIKTVLQNLLENAYKYTGRQAEARIELGRCPQRPEPCFYVRDNGVGFEKVAATRIFRPFQRLHRPEDFPGSGIGLANVQRIISRHGGEVWAEGQPNEGATFYFTLPMNFLSSSEDSLTPCESPG